MVLWHCMRLVAGASIQAYRLMHRFWKHMCTKRKTSISAHVNQDKLQSSFCSFLKPSESLCLHNRFKVGHQVPL